MATIRLPRDFKDFLKLLNAHDAKYLVIGGWAVVGHGYVRLTNDFDIWIPIDPENAPKVKAALLEFIAVAPTIEQLLTPNKIFRTGEIPNRIEVTTGIDGVIFEDCYVNRLTMSFDGVPAPVIELNDLLKNKRAAGRLKDLNDVTYLTKIQKAAKRKKK
jgi:hypothetical protein